MKKRLILLFFVSLAPASLFAQYPPAQVPQTYPYPGYANNNPRGRVGFTFTNRVGQVFSPEDLAVQLQNLRAVVDQTLPILSAFNEQYSNSVTAGGQNARGALSGIVTDALHRNQTQTPAQANGNLNALAATNLLSILPGLLSTNSTGAVGASPGNVQDLVALQNQLQSVEPLLQRLNGGPVSSQCATPYYNGPQPNPGGNLSPTGR